MLLTMLALALQLLASDWFPSGGEYGSDPESGGLSGNCV